MDAEVEARVKRCQSCGAPEEEREPTLSNIHMKSLSSWSRVSLAQEKHVTTVAWTTRYRLCVRRKGECAQSVGNRTILRRYAEVQEGKMRTSAKEGQ